MNQHTSTRTQNAGLATNKKGAPHTRVSADLVRAHIALLDYEIIQPSHPLFALVSYHAPSLQQWHSERTGWRIENRSGMFQLLRSPALLPTHFGKYRLADPADFACLAWTLSYAAWCQLSSYRAEQQFLLTHLAKYILEQESDSEEGEAIDLNRKTDRQSLMRALKYLEKIGALQLIEGQREEWVEHQQEMLYNFTPLATTLIVSLDAEAATDIEARLSQEKPLLPALLSSAHALTPLTRAWRSLLLGPIYLRYDDPEGFQALSRQAEIVAQIIADTFGWQLEMNHDYACIVRSTGSSQDSSPLLYFGSAQDQMIVLLCQALRAEVEAGRLFPSDSGCIKLSKADLEDLFASTIRPRYGSNWGKEARETSISTLIDEISVKMRQIGLLRGPDAESEMLVSPLAAHFEPSYAARQTGQGERSGSRPRGESVGKKKETASSLWDDKTQTD